MKKYLLMLMVMMCAGTAWACPVIVDAENRNYSGIVRVNTLNDQDGTTVYFCQTNGTGQTQHVTIDEDSLVSLSGGKRLNDGVANIAFADVFDEEPLGTSHAVMTSGVNFANPTFNEISPIRYPLSPTAVGNAGVFNFYVRATPQPNQWTSTIKREACGGRHGLGVSYQYIIDYLRQNASDIFEFSNIDTATWTAGTGDHIATAKANIKIADGATGMGVMPVQIRFDWLNNKAGQYFGTERSFDVSKRHLFCWVNVGVSITPDVSHANFRHAGTFGTKVHVLTH